MKKMYFLVITLMVITFSCKDDPINNLPEANDDSVSTNVNTPVNGQAQANDVPSLDGGNIWSLVGENGGAINGVVVMEESGNYTYAPDLNWHGTDEFQYQLCDENGDCDEATITIIVNPVVLTINDFSDLSISALAIDGNNKIWIASDNGLYTEIDGGFTLVSLGVSQKINTLTYESNNNTLWVGTNASIYKIILDNLTTIDDPIDSGFLSNDTIVTVYIDENLVRWVGTKKSVTRNEGDNWQKDNLRRYSTGQFDELPFANNAVNSIGMWEGDYYFATEGYKLWRLNGWDESIDAFTGASIWDPPYNGSAISDTMYAVFIDSRGLQWFGGQEGVQFHSGDDPKTENNSFKEELVNENVHCIAEDPNGNIWCGTEDGISIFDGSGWNTSTATLSNNFVTSIIFQGNTAWVGTKKGLNKISL